MSLHEKHATVERRPADRAATDEDMEYGEVDMGVRDIEKRPAVSNQARVNEELVVGKQASDRTEKIKDIVRRTDVNIEEDSGDQNEIGKTNRSRRR